MAAEDNIESNAAVDPNALVTVKIVDPRLLSVSLMRVAPSL